MRHAIKTHQPLDEKSEVLRKAFIRSAEALELTRQELSAIIGSSPASMSRLFDGKRHIIPNSKEGELTLILLRIYRSLDSLFGGNLQQCRAWLRAYNQHLNGIPSTLIQSIEGLYSVTMYLDAIRGKI